MNTMVKKIIIIVIAVMALGVFLVGSLYAYKKYKRFYNSPRCNAGRPLEIAEYIYEVNQREFPLEEYQNAKIRVKNPKTLKVSGGNYHCKCDLIIKMRGGRTYLKELYFISTKYSGSPMVLLQNQSFSQKARLIKK